MPKTPELLPSLPPSPTPTDDVAHVWHDDDTEDPGPSASTTHLSATSSGRKGKERSVSRERGPRGSDEEEDEEDLSGAVEGYPPTKEEEAESRRIEENLRRWEIAERQRRKAARESVASTSGGSTAPSLLADLRSSLFRRDSSRKASLGGVGTHHVLRTDDRDADGDVEGDGLPLEDMQTPTGAAFSAPPTPEPENPFDTPAASRTSLNIPANSAIMTESDSIPADFVEGEKKEGKKGPGPKRPTLEASSSFANPSANAKKQPPPPPKPIDIPAPRSPPPRTATPHADKPPEPIPPPTPAPAEPEPVDDGPPVRWWHEWLCGCGEGPDRGGDHQAGRTNPFE
ncbi:hypothetical protein BV20DRAFT_741511 [Pilatotrama ljubarskyi]|nr:hypothetical protein BV20DRAFT_741511 [Pilatotrama ljubarskyi]